MKKIKNVLFDLDGTLLNSIADIHYCVNIALRDFELPEMSKENVAKCVGAGWVVLVNNIFDNLYATYDNKQYLDRIREDFSKHYMKVYTKNSVVYGSLYDGVDNGLEVLFNHGLNLYVVSNKPNHIANDCIQKLNVDRYFKKVIGDGYYDVRKPQKELWDLLQKDFGMNTDDTVIVGDGTQDIDFARNAGIDVLVALYGGVTEEHLLIEKKEKNYFKSFNSVVEYILKNLRM